MSSEICRALAGILARGYDEHIRAHGPDGSAALRTPDGSGYEIGETMIGGAVIFIDRGGERFAVNVIALAEMNKKAPLLMLPFQSRPEGQL